MDLAPNALETPAGKPHLDFEMHRSLSSLDVDAKSSSDRSKILRKLGLTEMDIKYSIKLFAEANPSGCSQCSDQGDKVERILGYSVTRLRRSKALRLMGVTEEDIDLENSKNLGSLGTGGRKRSFIVITTKQQPSLFSCNIKEKQNYKRRLSFDSSRRRRKKSSSTKIDHKRRKSSTDFRNLKCALDMMHSSLRKQATSTQLEVVKLRERVRNLEEKIEEYNSSSILHSHSND